MNMDKMGKGESVKQRTKKKHMTCGAEELVSAAVGADIISGGYGGLMLIADAVGMRAALVRHKNESPCGCIPIAYTELMYDDMKECADRLVMSITPDEEDTMRIIVVGDDAGRLEENLRAALAYDDELACFDRRFERIPGTLRDLILAGRRAAFSDTSRGRENEDIFLILLDKDGNETEIRLSDSVDENTENGFYCAGGVLNVRAGGELFTLDVPEYVRGFVFACRSGENNLLLQNGSSRATLMIPRAGAAVRSDS